MTLATPVLARWEHDLAWSRARMPLSTIHAQMSSNGICDLPDDSVVVLYAEVVRQDALLDAIRAAISKVGPVPPLTGDPDTDNENRINWRRQRSEALADVETTLGLRGEGR